MSISSILSIADSGLSSATRRLGVVSQNVANAGTAGYAEESLATSALVAGGTGYGVTTGVTTVDVDAALQKASLAQDGAVAAQQTLQTALAGIDATQGTTAAGDDLASQLGALSDAFSELDATPSSQAQQIVTVDAAKTLATGINTLSSAIQTGRQTAQNALVDAVGPLNTALLAVGALSSQIVAARINGESSADLENQRAAQEQTAAQLAGIQFIPQASGGVLAVAGAGLVVDLNGSGAGQPSVGPFALAGATLAAGSAGPALTLEGTDVSAQITGGSIGANLQLRDTTLPQMQAGIDLFAKTLSNRFDDQGLRLFTDPNGNPPSPTGSTVAATDVGFAGIMQVNPLVAANPASVRDGTAVSSGGQTPNPAGGPAGYTALITAISQTVFGANPPPAATGLGAAGTITLAYQPSATLAGFASDLLATQSQASSDAQTALTTGEALQTTLASKMQDSSGVSVDTELSTMISLQNSYAANAKVIAFAQQLWTALVSAVNP